jgi:hypothetical protein
MFTILNKNCKSFGDVISSFILDLYKENKYKNILFVRSCSTGIFLDKVLIEKQDINRIIYYTGKKPKRMNRHSLVIHSNDLETHLKSLNKTFDLICMDTWHEFAEASRDFKVISELLNETGILISHDCYPWNKKVTNPSYTTGEWCGETYIAFVEFAYNNPNMFYTVLNIDTGIGIISKTHTPISLDKNKQEYLLYLHKNSKDPYTYFTENSKDIINAVNLT